VRRSRQFTSVILDIPSWVVALVSADERSDASIPKFDRRILLTLILCGAFLI
jgi:hypothetical protein